MYIHVYDVGYMMIYGLQYRFRCFLFFLHTVALAGQVGLCWLSSSFSDLLRSSLALQASSKHVVMIYQYTTCSLLKSWTGFPFAEHLAATLCAVCPYSPLDLTTLQHCRLFFLMHECAPPIHLFTASFPSRSLLSPLSICQATKALICQTRSKKCHFTSLN